MLDIVTMLSTLLTEEWSGTDPDPDTVKFIKDELDPIACYPQVLVENGQSKTTFVSDGIYRVDQQVFVSVHIKPTAYDPPTIETYKTSFFALKTEVDRILGLSLAGTSSMIMNGWQDVNFELGRDTGKIHNEPIVFRAIQTVMVTYYCQ